MTETHLVGLISDTHGLVRASVFDALAGVSLILHAGDVGRGVLDELATIAPVRAVFGNTDPPGLPELAESIELTLGGVSIHVSHGHELGRPIPPTSSSTATRIASSSCTRTGGSSSIRVRRGIGGSISSRVSEGSRSATAWRTSS